MNIRLFIDAICYDSRQRSPAPFLLFTLFVLIHPIAFCLLIRYALPGLWASELASGFAIITATFAIFHFVMSIGEYLFHRYVLHILTYEIMGVFYEKHTLVHHALTPIHIDEKRHRINSSYPISSVDQDDCGTFPPWALLSFLAGLSVPMVILALIFPSVPLLVAGYFAISLSYYLYEVIHVTHHKSYDAWWATKIKTPILGKIWRKIYGFHQAHHANYKCNMHVGGFFGLPIGDWLFGTYKQPSQLLNHEVAATKDMVQSLNPNPHWPISWFDKISQKRRSRILSNKK